MITFDQVKQLNDYVNDNIKYLPKETYKSMMEDFNVKFTHESTKIEGNTLSISEVKTILIDKLSIGGKELREIYEVTNNQKANKHIHQMLKQNRELDEELIKDIHQIVMENIIDGGIYRRYNVRITGASFRPPDWTMVRDDMKFFIMDYYAKTKVLNPIELASFVHAQFVKIHPFQDGNGRCARLLLNYVLMANGFKAIIIEASDRPSYYESLDKYASTGELNDFNNLVIEKEYDILDDLKSEIDKAKKFL